VTIKFEKLSFIDLSIPCLKTAIFQNGVNYFVLTYSFGLPITSPIIVSDFDLENLANEQDSEPNSQLQTYSKNSEVDNAAYNKGRLIGQILVLAAIFVLGFMTGFPTLLIMGLFLFALLITCQAIRDIIGDPIEEKSTLLGISYEIFRGGLSMLAPVFGKNENADLWISLCINGVFVVLHEELLEDYDVDTILALITIVFIPAISITLHNRKVEKDPSGWANKAWKAMAISFVFIGGLLLFDTLFSS